MKVLLILLLIAPIFMEMGCWDVCTETCLRMNGRLTPGCMRNCPCEGDAYCRECLRNGVDMSAEYVLKCGCSDKKDVATKDQVQTKEKAQDQLQTQEQVQVQEEVQTEETLPDVIILKSKKSKKEKEPIEEEEEEYNDDEEEEEVETTNKEKKGKTTVKAEIKDVKLKVKKYTKTKIYQEDKKKDKKEKKLSKEEKKKLKKEKKLREKEEKKRMKEENQRLKDLAEGKKPHPATYITCEEAADLEHFESFTYEEAQVKYLSIIEEEKLMKARIMEERKARQMAMEDAEKESEGVLCQILSQEQLLENSTVAADVAQLAKLKDEESALRYKMENEAKARMDEENIILREEDRFLCRKMAEEAKLREIIDQYEIEIVEENEEDIVQEKNTAIVTPEEKAMQERIKLEKMEKEIQEQLLKKDEEPEIEGINPVVFLKKGKSTQKVEKNDEELKENEDEEEEEEEEVEEEEIEEPIMDSLNATVPETPAQRQKREKECKEYVMKKCFKDDLIEYDPQALAECLRATNCSDDAFLSTIEKEMTQKYQDKIHKKCEKHCIKNCQKTFKGNVTGMITCLEGCDCYEATEIVNALKGQIISNDASFGQIQWKTFFLVFLLLAALGSGALNCYRKYKKGRHYSYSSLESSSPFINRGGIVYQRLL